MNKKFRKSRGLRNCCNIPYQVRNPILSDATVSPPDGWLLLHPRARYLDHPAIHRQGGADHVHVGRGRRPLPLGEGAFRGGAGGAECESVGCGVSVLGTRRQRERKVHGWHSGLWNGKIFQLLTSLTYSGQTLLTLWPSTKVFLSFVNLNMHH